ncbi:MAG: methyltransferase domain-containing protein, partial [Usitatibacter sp.]
MMVGRGAAAASARAFARRWLPPAVFGPVRRIVKAFAPPGDSLVLAPEGWRTPLPAADGLDSPAFVQRQRAIYAPLLSRPLGEGPLLFLGEDWAGPHEWKVAEHNHWLSNAYVFATVARRRTALSVLDYGGGFACSQRIAASVLPGVVLDFHCKELPRIAAAGREVNPDVTWHDTDECFERNYDLVIMSGVLQYVEHWRELLRRAATSADHLFLTDVSTVAAVRSYIAVQRVDGAAAHYQVLNRDELLSVLREAGMRVVREFLLDAHPRIEGAPEQPSYSAWLLAR